MKNTTKALLFKLPAIILLVGAFLASVYVKFANLYTISWATPIVLLLIVVLYFVGERLNKKGNSAFDF